MIEKINTLVCVGFISDSQKRRFFPKFVKWNGRVYPVNKIGLHHTYRKGKTLFHIFSVTTPGLFMRLSFNTDNLSWRLEEIADELSQ